MKSWVISTLIVSLCILQSYLLNIANASDLQIFAGRNYNNRSLDTLAQEFWQWWHIVPKSIPIDSNTGLQVCVIGHDSTNKTLLLFNSYLQDYSTSCSISSDKSILVPLLVGECDATVPEVRSKSVEELWKCAADADEVFKFWEVVLDGSVIFKKSPNEEVNSNLINEILVRNSSSFIINIPAENHYDSPEGSYPAVVDGYYLHLKPLIPGKHILTYKIVHEDPNVLDIGNKPRAVTGKASYVFNVN